MQEIIYQTKLEALTELLDIEGIPNTWPNKVVPFSSFLQLISQDSYNLSNLGLSTTATAKLLHSLFPNRGTGKVCFYILQKFGLKHCPRCHHVYDRGSFHSNKSRSDGLGVYCIDCFNDSVRDMRREYQAGRRASKLDRTPAWADLEEIKRIYQECPEGMHVDHIIPLQGVLVSGLHVENNLQYLPIQDNIAKSNKYTPT